MKLGPLFSLLSAVEGAGRYLVEKDEASEFLSRQDRANTHDGTEEFRSADLERECNEEVCDIDEAMEIFEDRDRANQFMFNRLHHCELDSPCFADGTKGCINKWDNYWCECSSGWYGKDCDYIDTKDGFVCQNEHGCIYTMGGNPAPHTTSTTSPSTTTTTTSTTTTTTTPAPVKREVKAFDPNVFCNVEHDRMRVELPSFTGGDMKMGLDVYKATCGETDKTERGVVFTYKFDECGTRMTLDEDKNFVFENHVGRGPLLTNGVYRDLGMSYNVRCIIGRHGHVDNQFVNETTGETGGEIVPIYTMPDNLALAIDKEGRDQYLFRLNVYHTELYQSRFEIGSFPLMMHFKEFVYLGVEVLTNMNNQYIFTERCWATPNADPLSRSQVYYPIMLDGCPSDDFTQLSPRINLEDRFKTETLKFPSGDFVYIQCDVLVCDLNIPNDPECQSTCRAPVGPQQVDVDRSDQNSQYRKKRSLSAKPRQLVTVGPIQVRKAKEAESSTATYVGWFAAVAAFAGLVGYVGYHKRQENKLAPQVL